MSDNIQLTQPPIWTPIQLIYNQIEEIPSLNGELEGRQRVIIHNIGYAKVLITNVAGSAGYTLFAGKYKVYDVNPEISVNLYVKHIDDRAIITLPSGQTQNNPPYDLALLEIEEWK